MVRHDNHQPLPNNALFQIGNGKIEQLWVVRIHIAKARRNLDMIPYTESCGSTGLKRLIHGNESVRKHQRLLSSPSKPWDGVRICLIWPTCQRMLHYIFEA